MVPMQKFRTAFRGFHREDVVRYIEYMNNQHEAQINQLNNRYVAAPELAAKLEAAQEECARLEAKVADLQAQLDACTAQQENNELEIYRRAERTERMAQERAQQIRQQANAALAEAALQADSAADQIGAVADALTQQLQQYQQAIADTKESFQQAAKTLYTIAPEEE